MILWMLAACRPEPERLMDTGWFDDTGWDEGCPHRYDAVRPAAGTTDWYWRDPLRVFTTSSRDDAYQAYVLDERGVRLDAARAWSDDGGSFALIPDAPLAPSTDHVLRVVDCVGTHEIPFRTSPYGAPLDGGAAILQGRSYDLRLQAATWLEPAGVAPLLALYFRESLILGVPLIDADSAYFLVALADRDSEGVLRQFAGDPAIPFPAVDFAEAPFFAAESPVVDLAFSGTRVPVYDFQFSGTFAADGSSIGGGRVRGLGDTRYAHGLVQGSGPGAVCELASSFGVTCEPCPTDDAPYCLPVHVENVRPVWVPGFTVQAQ